MKKTLVALTIALASSAALADKQPVTVVLTAQSTMTQGMAMVLTNQMQEQGAQVHVLLCDHAGDTASVCALYLPNSGKTAEDLKDGIKAAKPAEMGAALLEPNRKVIGF